VTVRIRAASRADAAQLTDIAFTAKRHWDYPESWIRLWADDLRIDADYVTANRVFAAMDGERIVGWCAVAEQDGEFWLDYCWVLPEAAGKGTGRRLVTKAIDVAAQLQARALKVIADPNAEGFYRRLGFHLIGRHPSVPAGRELPVLEAPVTRSPESARSAR
jgi:GNAT superfamily N-acetyltransferase